MNRVDVIVAWSSATGYPFLNDRRRPDVLGGPVSTPESRLLERGWALPPAPRPVANYVPWVEHGGLVFISGQIPMLDGQPRYLGVVGRDVDLGAARQAAEVAALSVLAQLREACEGDLGRVERVVKLSVFVAATAEFNAHPQVANAASDLLVVAFGDAGRHARAAVGVASLPLGVCVEIEAVVAVRS